MKHILMEKKEWQWLETGISVSTEEVLQEFNNS